MPNTKVYTAQEMRDMAENITRVDVMDGLTCREHCYPVEQEVKSMLRQAADAVAENARLAARLEAVVKECEKRMKEYDCGACDFTDEPPWTFEHCEMSADEIKTLAQQAFVYGMASHRAGLLDMKLSYKQYFAALLDYAAMVERCEKLKLNMIPHRHDKELVDYILRGDAGKEEK